MQTNSGIPDRIFKRQGRCRSEGAKDGYVQDDGEKLLGVCRGVWEFKFTKSCY